MSAVDIQQLREWTGRTETRADVITAAPVAALSASLNHAQTRASAGEALPPGWHWLYFQDRVTTANLNVDGHVRRGDFLPPVPLPRRMWAGSRLRFIAPLPVGAEVRRVSTIQSVEHKRGRSGDLVFVAVLHQIYCRDNLAIEEEQDLVYREQSGVNTAAGSAPATAVAQWSVELYPDPVLLFRYSALTFNSHRIHYDRDYAMAEEGYSGLVVQGPLTATLLLDLLHRELPTAPLTRFEFRAIRPLFAGAALQLQGRREGQQLALWALDAAGDVAMQARATLTRQ